MTKKKNTLKANVALKSHARQQQDKKLLISEKQPQVEKKAPSTKNMVTLTQTEFDAILETIGKLAVETRKTDFNFAICYL